LPDRREIFIPYHRYAGYLKFLTLVLLFYVVAAFSVQIPWDSVLVSTFAPKVSLDRDLLLTVVAVFGTTISPYLFFWQASQEAEESRLSHRWAHRARGIGKDYFNHILIDTSVGMFFSNLVAFFIIVTTAATLNAHGASPTSIPHLRRPRHCDRSPAN
jgi:Mn2+/Fe2+ NRAMP family transporter